MANLPVEIQGRNVAYKCFACLKLRNPIKSKPIIVNAIVAMAPDATGHIAIQVSAVHLCKGCFRWNKFLGRFADPVEIDPSFGKQRPQAQTIIDRETTMPKAGKVPL